MTYKFGDYLEVALRADFGLTKPVEPNNVERLVVLRII